MVISRQNRNLESKKGLLPGNRALLNCAWSVYACHIGGFFCSLKHLNKLRVAFACMYNGCLGATKLARHIF